MTKNKIKGKTKKKRKKKKKGKKKRNTKTKTSTIDTIRVSPQICRIWEPRTCELAIFRREHI